ncbi:MAG TPA: carbohydrate-binding protein [Limnochordales bacterium]
MAGLLQSLRRAFTGAAEPQRTPAARATEEYGELDAPRPEAATTLVERRNHQERREVPDDGVYVKPTPVTSGQTVTIWYSGLLARHGADQVYLHYGFGPGRWQDVQDVPMKRVGWIGDTPLWEARVQVRSFGTLEFCFHDSADHWDNNNGHNWVYQIHWGAFA